MPVLLRRFASFRDKVTWLATSVSALAIMAVATALLAIDYIKLVWLCPCLKKVKFRQLPASEDGIN